MDRRKTLATVGAISLTASAAFVALGSSMGLFGLTDNSPRVGQLSPIDATQPAGTKTKTRTVYVDDVVPVPTPAAGASGSGSETDGGSRRDAATEGKRSDGDGSGGDRGQVGTTPSGSTSAPTAVDDRPGGDGSHREGTEVEDRSSGSGHVGDDD